MSVTHSKVSAVADDADTSLVRPSDWNAAHTGTIDDSMHGVRTLANAHAHADLSGVGANDHHAQDHASRHAPNGADHGVVATGTYATGSLTIPTGQWAMFVSKFQLTTTQSLTAQGTAALRGI